MRLEEVHLLREREMLLFCCFERDWLTDSGRKHLNRGHIIAYYVYKMNIIQRYYSSRDTANDSFFTTMSSGCCNKFYTAVRVRSLAPSFASRTRVFKEIREILFSFFSGQKSFCQICEVLTTCKKNKSFKLPAEGAIFFFFQKRATSSRVEFSFERKE